MSYATRTPHTASSRLFSCNPPRFDKLPRDIWPNMRSLYSRAVLSLSHLFSRSCHVTELDGNHWSVALQVIDGKTLTHSKFSQAIGHKTVRPSSMLHLFPPSHLPQQPSGREMLEKNKTKNYSYLLLFLASLRSLCHLYFH